MKGKGIHLLVLPSDHYIDLLIKLFEKRKDSYSSEYPLIIWTTQLIWQKVQKKIIAEGEPFEISMLDWPWVGPSKKEGVYVVTIERSCEELFDHKIKMGLKYEKNSDSISECAFHFVDLVIKLRVEDGKIVEETVKECEDKDIQKIVQDITPEIKAPSIDYDCVPDSLVEFNQTPSKDRINVKPYLIIGCGARSITSANAVSPTKKIVLECGGGKLFEVSFLELKLLEWEQAKKHFQDKVYLMVTPVTEDAIQHDLDRIRERHRWGNILEKVQFLKQPMHPAFTRTEENQEIKYQNPIDGGFSYSPSGHGYVLDLVSEIKGSESDWFYYTSCFNLGKNLKQKTAVKGKISFELFYKENSKPIEELDNGHSILLSFHGRPKLIKKNYDIEVEEILKEETRLFVSTGSVLFPRSKCEELFKELIEFSKPDIETNIIRKPDKPNDPNDRNLIYSALENISVYSVWKDLDSITESEGKLCDYFTVNEKAGVPCEYIGFRKESDLSESNLQKVTKAHKNMVCETIKKLQKDYEEDCEEKADSKINRLIPLIPVYYNALWGGHEIPFRKNRDNTVFSVVSESHEGSFYAGGMMQLKIPGKKSPVSPCDIPHFNDENNRPNVMAKFLDVQNWLSIQVHPDLSFIELLNDLKSHDEKIKDKEGKEERFVIICNDKYKPDPGEKGNFVIGVQNNWASLCTHRLFVKGELCGKTVGSKVFRNSESLITRFFEKIGKIESITEKLKSEIASEFKNNIVRDLLDVIVIRNKYEAISSKTTSLITMIGVIEAIRKIIKDSAEGDNSKNAANLLNDPVFWNRIFYRIDNRSLKEGNVIEVPSGMIHAAGPGLLLLEGSQDSDNTFRILDTGRESKNNYRETHYKLAALSVSEDNFVESKIDWYVHPLESHDDSKSLNMAVDIKRLTNLQPVELSNTDWYILNHSSEVVVELNADGFQNIERLPLGQMHSAFARLTDPDKTDPGKIERKASVYGKNLGPFEAYAVATTTHDVTTQIWFSINGYRISVYIYNPSKRTQYYSQKWHELEDGINWDGGVLGFINGINIKSILDENSCKVFLLISCLPKSIYTCDKIPQRKIVKATEEHDDFISTAFPSEILVELVKYIEKTEKSTISSCYIM